MLADFSSGTITRVAYMCTCKGHKVWRSCSHHSQIGHVSDQIKFDPSWMCAKLENSEVPASGAS